MPIEFKCMHCERLLRTGDNTAGRQAKCPACGAIVTVPATEDIQTEGPQSGESPFASTGAEPAQNPFGDHRQQTTADTGCTNPFQTPPQYGAGQAYAAAGAAGPMQPTQIDFSETLSRSWTAFTEQLGMCILVAFLCFIMNFAAGQAGNIARMLVAAAGNEAAGALISFPLSLAAQLFIIWINIGLAMFYLKVARGQEAPISNIFAGGPYLLRLLGASILLGLLCMGIIIACCLPGGAVAAIGAAQNADELTTIGYVILGLGAVVGLIAYFVVFLMFSQFYYLIIDRNMSVTEAFSTSREIMNGNKLTVFGILFLVGLICMCITIFTCGIGALFAFPYMGVLYAIIYLAVSGQPTMADFRNLQYQTAPMYSGQQPQRGGQEGFGP